MLGSFRVRCGSLWQRAIWLSSAVGEHQPRGTWFSQEHDLRTGVESPLFRALRPELGRRENYLGQTETPRREAWGFVFPRCRSHPQSGLATGLEKLAPCRLIGVRGKISDEGFMGARRSTATGSARWFPYPTITWEPPLLTWVV